MRSARAADIDNYSLLSVLDSEVFARLSDQPEGSCIVHGKDRIPLLVCDLVDDSVPGIPGVVYYYVDLAIAKLCSLADEDGEVVCVGDVSRYGDCALRAGRSVVDLLCDGVRLGGINIAYHYFRTFIGEKTGALGANPLA